MYAEVVETRSRSSRKIPYVLLLLGTVLGLLAGYTFTNHALNSHLNQTWNAKTITEAFDSGRCIPTQYSCWPSESVDIRYCELKGGKKGLSIGLILAAGTEHVISAFAAPTSKWENRCGHNK
jgi:hypothetical protein